MPSILDLGPLIIDRPTLLKIANIFAGEEGTSLLYSGGSYETSQRSFLCLFPYVQVKIQQGRQMCCRLGSQETVLHHANPWDALKVLFEGLGSQDCAAPEWIGYLGYEMGAFSDPEKLLPYHPANTPDAFWQKCALVLIIDHIQQKSKVCIADHAETFFTGHWKTWVARLSETDCWHQLVNFLSEHDYPKEDRTKSYCLTRASDTRASYIEKVKAIQELIHAGDVYQVNLSQQFECSGNRDAFQLFRELAELNPAPFAAYMNLGDFSIISSSPERFLSRTGSILETRPIKGTSPRGKTEEEDAANRQNLLSSTKEDSELLMITDLMRNDLSRVSQSGSVSSSWQKKCQKLANVFHLYSIVQSEMRGDLHPLDVIRVCFPGGSITGCPKFNAMQVIRELENRPRGIYTGSIGYFAYNGDFDFNIAIRTCIATAHSLAFHVGGAVVIDSLPEKEFEETIHKGRSIFQACRFSLSNLFF